ncbi:MAG: hypothetical protein ACNA8N_10195 [Trueperaceae bacterium]
MSEQSVTFVSYSRIFASPWARSLMVLLGVVALGVLQVAVGEEATPVALVPLDRVHDGLVFEPEALFGVLSDLGVVPGDGSGPSVVYLATADSSGMRDLRRDRVLFAASALADIGAGPLSVVTVPWGRSDDRLASGRTFPADDQALLDMGYDFLVGRDDLVVTPDVEAAVAELLAARSMRYGLERLGVIDLIVCLDGEGVRAWGTAFHRKNAFPGSLDVFIGECLSGDLQMEPPGSGLGAVTGVEGWQALVFPSAFFDRLGEAPRIVDAVREHLAIAREPVPVFVLAAPTLTSDGVWVSADDHAAVLAEQGVVVDRELGERLPGWVWEMVYFPQFVLLVDPDGAVAAMLYGSDGTTFGSLAAELVRLGLF